MSDQAKDTLDLSKVITPIGQIECVRPATEKEASAVDVLREHIAFLRNLLDSKRLWHEQMLSAEREQVTALRANLSFVMLESVQLRIALAQAVKEIEFHNEQDDNPHRTEVSNLNFWNEMVYARHPERSST